MKKLVSVAASIAAMLIAAQAPAATYVVNRSVQAQSGGLIGTAVGTISTDGTIGVLASNNITDFDITVTLAGYVRSFSRARGWYNIVGNAFSASNTALSFDTQLSSTDYVYFSSDTAYYPGVYGLYSSMGGDYVQVYDVSVASGRGGIVDFAQTTSAVPEPATWIAMMLGFAGVGAAMRRRRSTSSESLTAGLAS